MVERIKAALFCGSRLARFDGMSRRLLLGIGDDSAIVESAPKKDWAISTDFFLEGVHFLINSHPPESVGFKALARATSDLAAVGAIPRYFLLGIALPRSRAGRWLHRMLTGMRKAAETYGMTVIGGDTSSYQTIILSITVIGETKFRHVVTRAGAEPGDGIYVSGVLGRAALGLELIRRGTGIKKGLQSIMRQHLYPEVQIKLGAWLARNQVASAMIDVSDGLSTDLGRICEASKVGATIYVDKIPSPAVPDHLRKHHNIKLDIDNLALHGGDDYELLFTAPPSMERRLLKAPQAEKIRRIGAIQKRRVVLLVNRNGKAESLVPGGWDSFRG